MTEKLTEAIEEYLEILYRLYEEEKELTNTEIAKKLKIAPGSVSEMLQKLAEKGYITYTPYRAIKLTHKGLRTGKKIVRRHRIIEQLLLKFGVPNHKLHEEACKLEHSVSDDVEKAFNKIISHKEIPPTTKEIQQDSKIIAISSMRETQRGKIISIVAGRNAAQRLADLGLTKGTEFVVVRAAPFRGPIEILVRNTRLAIGRGLSAKVFAELK